MLLVSATILVEGLLIRFIIFCLKNLNSTEKKMSVDKQNGYKVITYNEKRIPEVINDKSKNVKNEYEV